MADRTALSDIRRIGQLRDAQLEIARMHWLTTQSALDDADKELSRRSNDRHEALTVWNGLLADARIVPELVVFASTSVADRECQYVAASEVRAAADRRHNDSAQAFARANAAREAAVRLARRVARSAARRREETQATAVADLLLSGARR